MSRLVRAWRQLAPEQRLAAVAAVALLLSMFLPWYQQNAVDRAGLISQDLNAFAVFSFLEATILLTALGVLALLFARAEGRSPLPPSIDGAVVLAGGAWTVFVLFLRLFDKPGVESHGIAANVGVQWGIFFALAAAGLLAYAGARMHAMRPLPPLVASARARAGRGRWRDDPRRTRERAWRTSEPPGPEGKAALPPPASERREPPSPRRRAKPPRTSSGSPSAATAAGRAGRPAPARQLSFDDDPAISEEAPPASPA